MEDGLFSGLLTGGVILAFFCILIILCMIGSRIDQEDSDEDLLHEVSGHTERPCRQSSRGSMGVIVRKYSGAVHHRGLTPGYLSERPRKPRVLKGGRNRTYDENSRNSDSLTDVSIIGVKIELNRQPPHGVTSEGPGLKRNSNGELIATNKFSNAPQLETFNRGRSLDESSLNAANMNVHKKNRLNKSKSTDDGLNRRSQIRKETTFGVDVGDENRARTVTWISTDPPPPTNVRSVRESGVSADRARGRRHSEIVLQCPKPTSLPETTSRFIKDTPL